MAELRGPDSTDDMEAVLAAPTPAKRYSDYLMLPGPLALQRPLAQAPVHDELSFIIVHQTHELWFEQILCELSVLVDDIDGGRIGAARRTLERIGKIARLLAEQVQILETLPVAEFQRFRDVLGTASGLESQQFGRLEKLAGSPPKAVRWSLSAAAYDTPSVSVREAFCRAMAAHDPGLARPPRTGVGPQSFGQALVALLAQPALAPELSLAEGLLALDEQLVLWRQQHSELARALLDGAGASGGSTSYLRSTTQRSFFPELWHWRAAHPSAPQPASP
jgi:tryptophan 2,3-dioxygenase